MYHNEEDFRIHCVDAAHNKGSHYFKEVVYKGTFSAGELKETYLQQCGEETKKFERNLQDTLKAALEIVTFREIKLNDTTFQIRVQNGMDTHDHLSKSYVSETVIMVKLFLTIFCIPVGHQNVLKAAKYLKTLFSCSENDERKEDLQDWHKISGPK